MKSRRSIVASVASIAGLCCIAAFWIAFTKSRPSRNDDSLAAIEEAVFRFQFRQNASVQQQRAPIYFLAFGDPHEKNAADPSPEFLARFGDLKMRVAKFSDAGRTESGWVIHRITREPGIIFYVHAVRRTGPDTAEARGGYREDIRSGSGNTYRLKRDWRGWGVKGAVMDWIS